MESRDGRVPAKSFPPSKVSKYLAIHVPEISSQLCTLAEQPELSAYLAQSATFGGKGHSSHSSQIRGSCDGV